MGDRAESPEPAGWRAPIHGAGVIEHAHGAGQFSDLDDKVGIMKKQKRTANITLRASSAGFSLVELMVAMAIFLVVGGAAVELAKKHVPLFTSQQNQTGLNLAMRN